MSHTGTGVRVCVPVAAVALATVLLAGCGPSPLRATTTPTATLTVPTPTPVPTASPTITDAPTPEPTSTTPAVDVPPTGDILVVTAEERDGLLEVSAMLPGITESDGSCVLQVVGDMQTEPVAATVGNGVTYCGVMSLRPAAADSSEWRFQVLYTSPATTAASDVSTLGAFQ